MGWKTPHERIAFRKRIFGWKTPKERKTHGHSTTLRTRMSQGCLYPP